MASNEVAAEKKEEASTEWWVKPAGFAVLAAVGVALGAYAGGWGAIAWLVYTAAPGMRTQIWEWLNGIPGYGILIPDDTAAFDSAVKGWWGPGTVLAALVVLAITAITARILARRKGFTVPGLALIALGLLVPALAVGWWLGQRRSTSTKATNGSGAGIRVAPEPGDGAWLGVLDQVPARSIWAPARGACLVIGPPGSGKTTAVLEPTVALARGFVLSSSTKTDVLEATLAERAAVGRCWIFDPAQELDLAGVTQIRWSPLTEVRDWDTAKRQASALVAPMRAGGNDQHWNDQAMRLIQCLMYAAFIGGYEMPTVADWVLDANQPEKLETPLQLLMDAAASGSEAGGIAVRVLEQYIATPDRERGSIASTAARAVAIYTDEAARRIARGSNITISEVVRTSDTIYITTPIDQAEIYAPVIVAFVDAVRFAIYARHRAGWAGTPALFVLDEVNSTAPVDVPAIVAEGGGQGLHLVIGLQDLSRARGRWGQAVDGWLTTFGSKIVLPGLVEDSTLRALSMISGDHHVQYKSVSTGSSRRGVLDQGSASTSESLSMHRERIISEADIAQLGREQAIVWLGATPHRVRLQPWYAPWWASVREALGRSL